MDIDQLHANKKLRDHVIQELDMIGGIRKGDEINIICPFHSDSSPSLGVHVGHKVTPGTFNCFACPAHGGWNKLAHALKLKPVAMPGYAKKQIKVNNDDEPDPFALLLEEHRRREALDQPAKTLKGVEPLPDTFSWRGYPRKLYQKLGAQYYWTEDTQSIHFPLNVNGAYHGYTLCTVASEAAKFKKYLIFGEASKTLFLYDHLVAGVPIVLTEGHFDAIRLIGEGFNATAIFGVQNWSTYKRDLVIAKNPPRVIIAFDGDRPGYDASVEIFNTFREVIDVDIFYLPLKDPKLDPGNMSGDYLRLLEGKTYGEGI